MKYADVIVDISHEKLDRPFTYRIPEAMEDTACVGMAVKIPFGSGNRQRKGYIIDIRDSADADCDESALKEIASAAPKQRSVEEEFIELACWMKERYGCTFARALKTVLPVSKLVKARAGSNPVTEGRKQYRLHTPNAAQQAAIDTFTKAYDQGRAQQYLLHGVTGSGKTDAYLHMIRHVVESGRKVILLIPEISLTYQTIDRLYAAFGERIAVIHSRLSPGEKCRQFLRCENGEADIMIGPRSAVFAPFRNLGLIIIDEEHDNAYKNENVPRYHTTDVAARRAQMHQASLVLASATPCPASYAKALSGEYVLLKLPERTAGAAVPVTEIVDMRQELRSGNRSIFSVRLAELIRERLARKEQVILFMNRRGYSNFVSCRSCGTAVKCPHCDISLTLHRNFRMVCHYCGYTQEMPKNCPSCASPYIAEFGTGTQKLESMARKMFPEARIARLDTDAAARKNAGEEILRAFAAGETDILIGTQMVVKGHDYHNVTLVGIMAADTSLFVSDYTSGERTYELIAQAAGRAGRGKKPGTVIVQTYQPEHYAIACAAKGDYEEYFRNETAFRRLLHYPPAFHVMTVQLSDQDETALQSTGEIFGQELASAAAKYGAEMIGPVNAAVYKLNDYFRKLTYIKHKEYDILLKIKKEAEVAAQERGLRVSALYDFT